MDQVLLLATYVKTVTVMTSIGSMIDPPYLMNQTRCMKPTLTSSFIHLHHALMSGPPAARLSLVFVGWMGASERAGPECMG